MAYGWRRCALKIFKKPHPLFDWPHPFLIKNCPEARARACSQPSLDSMYSIHCYDRLYETLASYHVHLALKKLATSNKKLQN